VGKPSKLRITDQPKENRQAYSNGDRKFYDKDAAPQGADFDTWSLTLLFEQLAEEDGRSLPGRIIVYTNIRSRLEKSNFIQEDNGQWAEILEEMICKFWSDYVGDYPLDDFCQPEYFNWCHQWILDTRKRKELLKSGTRVIQNVSDKKPAKQDNTDLEIIFKRYTEEEVIDKMKDFRKRLDSGDFD
jgi:hypothetical protein